MLAVILEFEKPIAELETKISEMESLSENVDISPELEGLKKKLEQMREEIYSNLTPWQKVQLARHPDRPRSLDYIERISLGFVELHGDRLYGDDHAIVAGFGKIENTEFMIISQQKGKDTKSHVYRNFGMPNPEGYRKALRLMNMAAKFKRPILTLIDTPGAYPGIGAEERGQAEAIARNLLVMSRLPVPIICVIIGEGASGGALGIGVGDRLLMMENTWYSVIAPESCSSILWRSWEFKEKAASALKLTADDLMKFNVIDGIIKEPIGGANRDYVLAAKNVKEAVMKELETLEQMPVQQLLEERVEKYSKMGRWGEMK
ncbi:acetyl-CoA carboxylase carboxyltransferase subunit alpha [bacterium]|nr:MAG: acetyl-CoA carboxylase carboxyltransferase subunit alpha [bacterium]